MAYFKAQSVRFGPASSCECSSVQLGHAALFDAFGVNVSGENSLCQTELLNVAKKNWAELKSPI